MKKIAIVIMLLSLLFLSGCDFLTDLFGGSDVEGRPALPEVESYIASVPDESDELVVETVTPLEYTPLVASALDSDGHNIFQDQEIRMTLVSNGAIVQSPTAEGYTGADFQPLVTQPVLQLVRYWVRVGDPERYPGGYEISTSRTYEYGTTTSESYSFTETIGIEASASGGIGLAEVKETLKAEFSATQEFESEFESSTSTEETYTVSPEEGTNIVIVYWQLYEEFRLVNAEVDTETGEYEAFTDPSYTFTEESTAALVLPTTTIIPTTYTFKNE